MKLDSAKRSQARRWRDVVVEDRGRVWVNDAELNYEVGGEGQPLVLLHDGLLDRRVWDDQFVAFARLYRTIRYDRRGYGKSSMPDRAFSDVSDLHHLLGPLGTEKAYLMGMSNGGEAALEFALEHLRMVAALVLVGPNLGGYCPSEEKQRRVSEIRTSEIPYRHEDVVHADHFHRHLVSPSSETLNGTRRSHVSRPGCRLSKLTPAPAPPQQVSPIPYLGLLHSPRQRFRHHQEPHASA